jgi:hypothetical protein
VGAGIHPRYQWSSRAVVWASRAAGWPVPTPEYAPATNPTAVLDRLVATRRQGATPYMICFSSAAAAVCEAALKNGVDISGSQLLPTGEPFTPARQSILRQAGVHVVTRYGAMDAGGGIGYGCEAGVESDDVHVVSDLHAVIQSRDTAPGVAAPLYLTSLSPRAPHAMINVALGDSAVLSECQCGCPLQSLGWTTHAHTIRSPEKLTAGAVNLLDVDIIRIIEEVLPRAFGGSPLDYQLVEDEDDAGRSVVRLLIAPEVGIADEAAVKQVLLREIGSQGGAQQIMALAWAETDAIRVERRAPYVTAGGKILHVHSARARP